MIRAVIVDDEPPARRELQRLLAAHADVELVGEAGSVRSAGGLVERVTPDVVFLDIELGDGSGFSVLERVDPTTCVVFVTAYDAYAVRAFEASALDYLMKPVAASRLSEALGRVRRVQAARGTRPGGHVVGEDGPFIPGKWIFVGDPVHPEFLRVADIACIEVSDKTRQLVTGDGRRREVTQPIRVWERLVPGVDFIRVSRSTLVNLAHVLRVEPWSNYSYRVFVRGLSDPLTMSRRRAQRLRTGVDAPL